MGQLDQVLAGALEQPAVGRVGDGLGHHGRVDDDPVHAGLADHAGLARRLDGQRQQRLDAFLADALAPTRQARRIDRQFGLQVDRAGEELPVRVVLALVKRAAPQGLTVNIYPESNSTSPH